jgi:hypothetical protein
MSTEHEVFELCVAAKCLPELEICGFPPKLPIPPVHFEHSKDVEVNSREVGFRYAGALKKERPDYLILP